MKTHSSFIFSLLLLLTSQHSFIQKHLVPCTGSLFQSNDDRIAEVRIYKALGLDFTSNDSTGWPVFRAFIRPSYYPEQSLTMYLPKEGYVIIEAAVAAENIYEHNFVEVESDTSTSEMVRQLLSEEYKVKVSRYRATMGRAYGQTIIDLFSKYIRTVHSRDSSEINPGKIVLDGTSYTFGFHDNHQYYCAVTADPESGSVCDKLVDCSYLLINYAKADPEARKKIFNELVNTINSLK